MGSVLSSILDRTIFHKKGNLVILGIDGSGKSTITYKLTLDENVKTIPTIGYNQESVKYKQLTLNVFDLGGNLKIRPLWRHHFAQASCLIFVLDSSNIDRLDESCNELQKLSEDPNLKDKPLLILANKQDISGALSPDEIKKRCSIQWEGANQWFGCSAMTGEGIFEAMDWLAQQKW